MFARNEDLATPPLQPEAERTGGQGASLIGDTMQNAVPLGAHPVHLPSGSDRFSQNELMIWGLLPLSIKLSARDTGGELLLFEHKNMGKGGPPRHIHFEQDEWFYVIKGEFEFELGSERYHLTAGDTLFAPRGIPHGWAHVGDTPGTLLTMVTPAGTFEDFILDTTRHATVPPQKEMEQTFAAHKMKVVGPPLEIL